MVNDSAIEDGMIFPTIFSNNCFLMILPTLKLMILQKKPTVNKTKAVIVDQSFTN